jgi:hypothetical protein
MARTKKAGASQGLNPDKDTALCGLPMRVNPAAFTLVLGVE